MTLEGMKTALKNIYFMLKPGGCFRLIVPDLESRVKKYLHNQDCDSFIESIGFGKKKTIGHLKIFLEKFLVIQDTYGCMIINQSKSILLKQGLKK
jgi:predicted SAM-dependent methyltransferase